jgi:hypothetical protein
MVPVASAFISMFLETIAAAVERKHYPTCRPRGPSASSRGWSMP